MAEFNVTTWTELKQALQNARPGVSGEYTHTINILNDIDCNDGAPEGQTQFRIGWNTQEQTALNVTINGNHHEIRNLRTSITSPSDIMIIQPDNYFHTVYYTWNDIDWRNLVLTNGCALIRIADWYNRATQAKCTFNRNRFVGRRTGLLFKNYGDTSYRWNFTSCFFNIPNVSSSASSDAYSLFQMNTLAYYSWFRETYYGQGGSYTFGTFYAQETACYTDGELVSTQNRGFNLNDYPNSYTPTIQNVVDAKLSLLAAPTSSFAIQAPKGVFKNKVTLRSDESQVFTNFTYNSGAISATPEEMTDPAALFAKGFDIIVPE